MYAVKYSYVQISLVKSFDEQQNTIFLLNLTAGFHKKYNEIPEMLVEGQKFEIINFLLENHLVIPLWYFQILFKNTWIRKNIKQTLLVRRNESKFLCGEKENWKKKHLSDDISQKKRKSWLFLFHVDWFCSISLQETCPCPWQSRVVRSSCGAWLLCSEIRLSARAEIWRGVSLRGQTC